VDADELIRQADTAAYRAKAAGGGTVEVCAPTLIGHVESR
jgi:GGDEF domain-containing protein